MLNTVVADYTKGRKFILVLSQRDIKHPFKGGAEVYTHNALITLASKVPIVHIGVKAKGMVESEVLDGILYLRKGTNLINIIPYAVKFHNTSRDNILAIIDQSNTHQFLTFIWAKKKRILLIHQLTQEIWGYFFGGIVGFICSKLENLLLFLSRGETITVSRSTEGDLRGKGFTEISICPEGNTLVYNNIPDVSEKEDYFVYTGRLVPYKRVEDVIVFARGVGKRLIILGHGDVDYEERLRKLSIDIACDCDFRGFVSSEEKRRIVEKAHMLIMPSIREGWGLVITESGNLGTPSLVYKCLGTYEAIDYGKAGFVADEMTPESLITRYNAITDAEYNLIRIEAFEFSKKFTWAKTSDIFCEQVLGILKKRGVNYDDFTA